MNRRMPMSFAEFMQSIGEADLLRGEVGAEYDKYPWLNMDLSSAKYYKVMYEIYLLEQSRFN